MDLHNIVTVAPARAKFYNVAFPMKYSILVAIVLKRLDTPKLAYTYWNFVKWLKYKEFYPNFSQTPSLIEQIRGTADQEYIHYTDNRCSFLL